MTLADPQASISDFAKAKLIGSLCDGYRLVLICNQLLEQGIQPSVDDFQISIEDEVLSVKAVFLESPMQPNSSWSSITLMMSQLLPKSKEIGVFYRPTKNVMRSVVDRKPLAAFDFVTQDAVTDLAGETPILPEIIDSSVTHGIDNSDTTEEMATLPPVQSSLDIPALLSKLSQNAQIDSATGVEPRHHATTVNTHYQDLSYPEEVPSLISREPSFSEANRLLSGNDAVITKNGVTLGDSEQGNIVNDFESLVTELLDNKPSAKQAPDWQVETESLSSLRIATKVNDNNLYLSTKEQSNRFDRSVGHTFNIDDQYIDDMFGTMGRQEDSQVKINPATLATTAPAATAFKESSQISLPDEAITVDTLRDYSLMAEDLPPQKLAKFDIGDVPVFGKTDASIDKINASEPAANNTLDAVKDSYAAGDVAGEPSQEISSTPAELPETCVAELMQNIEPQLTQNPVKQNPGKHRGIKVALLILAAGAVSAVGTYYYAQDKADFSFKSTSAESKAAESIMPISKSSKIKAATAEQSDQALTKEKLVAGLIEQLQDAKSQATNELRQLKEARLTANAQNQKTITLKPEKDQVATLTASTLTKTLPKTGVLQTTSVAGVDSDSATSLTASTVMQIGTDSETAIRNLQPCVTNYDNGDQYNGECLNGAKYGQGIFYWQSGDRYEGSWLNNVRHGDGVMISSAGLRTTGQWRNGQISGNARIEWPSGTRYVGEMKNGVSHGSGTIFYTNGDSYKGEFQRGMKNGYGVLLMSRGAKYEGFYSNNKKQGQGTYWSEKGYRYEGAFRGGYFTQDGTCIEEDGNRYKGPCK